MVIEALEWLKVHNPYYKDVTVDPSRIAGIPEGSEIPGAMEMNADGGLLPDDLGPAPGQNEVGAEASEEGYGTGGMPLPEVAPNYREEVRKLIVSANGQQDSGRKHVEFPWPAADSEPVSKFRTRSFFCVAFPWLFPGGVGCFFDDRPYGE